MDSRSVSLGLITFLMVATAAEDSRRSTTYIVHMDKSVMPDEFPAHDQWYKSLLSSVKGVSRDESIKDEDLFLYIYDNVMHGFSAMLTQSELDMLEEMPGHLISYPDLSGTIDTTHSTEFLGLDGNSGLLPKSRFGQDVIVGVLDTGIWPESRSFNDNGMEPVPTRWKGSCANGTDFSPSLCNRKLIGARYFNKAALAKYGKIDPNLDYDSPRDFDGHGSHTASTIGGNYVDHVDYFGFAPGTARGVAPQGRVAMYKVFWAEGQLGSDVLAGMESAITDGVDVLSMSIGFDSPPYFEDIIAIGAFEAMKRGVLVVCSIGNFGPNRGILHNGAPWIFTVAASTLDRDYAPALKLGDGTVLQGSSFYLNTRRFLNVSQAPLFYQSSDSACQKLDGGTIKEKVVLCVNMDYELLTAIEDAGAKGLISVTDNQTRMMLANEFFPVAVLKPQEGEAIVRYASSAANPIVDMIFNITVLGTKPAPVLAYFSSRGPNPASPNILKPDITAPGVNILAAWRSNVQGEPDYNMISGTSMSCPHVAGVSALVKSVHREWSPAAIRSAMMTTSYTLDNSNNPFLNTDDSLATPLEFGAGHVNPEKAIDPGLVYDLEVEDYVNFLCTLNYTASQLQIITKSSVACPKGADLGSDALNYPSFTAIFFTNSNTSTTFTTFRRTLTNVGDRESRYSAVVEAPRGLKVSVEPAVLEFKKKFVMLNFTVRIEVEDWTGVEAAVVRSGYLSWIDNQNHVVKSPLFVLFQLYV